MCSRGKKEITFHDAWIVKGLREWCAMCSCALVALPKELRNIAAAHIEKVSVWQLNAGAISGSNDVLNCCVADTFGFHCADISAIF